MLKSFSYGIKEHRRHGEAGSVDPAAAATERERLQPIIAKYEPDDVFNGDEGALFTYAPPDRGLSTKALSGKKAQKFRITLFFVCNSTGTQKEPLMYIGKYQKPRCFKNIPAHEKKKFYYRWNSKAWMNSVLFEECVWFPQMFSDSDNSVQMGQGLRQEDAPSWPPCAPHARQFRRP
ncbi:DDE-domain-containing protein [Auricularia subglabra TFB-10046 SS5]|nr:DDE-domain-containing protein [Auricularia subglabra TFB-10046 SS5]